MAQLVSGHAEKERRPAQRSPYPLAEAPRPAGIPSELLPGTRRSGNDSPEESAVRLPWGSCRVRLQERGVAWCNRQRFGKGRLASSSPSPAQRRGRGEWLPPTPDNVARRKARAREIRG